MSYETDMMQKRAYANSPGPALTEIRNKEIIPNLKAQRQELTARIQKIDALLSILEKNPEFARMFDLARELV